MPASVRVDAFPEKPLKRARPDGGHGRLVERLHDLGRQGVPRRSWPSTTTGRGLKPGMSAEVTIHVDNTLENVLAVPVQAVVGGAESGRTRKVFVMTPDGPEEREIQIGLSNEKMAEVKSGLQAGDQVVVNPKAILGNAAKTREDMPELGDQGPRRQGQGRGRKAKGKRRPAGGGGPRQGAAGQAVTRPARRETRELTFDVLVS